MHADLEQGLGQIISFISDILLWYNGSDKIMMQQKKAQLIEPSKNNPITSRQKLKKFRGD